MGRSFLILPSFLCPGPTQNICLWEGLRWILKSKLDWLSSLLCSRVYNNLDHLSTTPWSMNYIIINICNKFEALQIVSAKIFTQDSWKYREHASKFRDFLCVCLTSMVIQLRKAFIFSIFHQAISLAKNFWWSFYLTCLTFFPLIFISFGFILANLFTQVFFLVYSSLSTFRSICLLIYSWEQTVKKKPVWVNIVSVCRRN